MSAMRSASPSWRVGDVEGRELHPSRRDRIRYGGYASRVMDAPVHVKTNGPAVWKVLAEGCC